jgi:hypothetical protein
MAAKVYTMGPKLTMEIPSSFSPFVFQCISRSGMCLQCLSTNDNLFLYTLFSMQLVEWNVPSKELLLIFWYQ